MELVERRLRFPEKWKLEIFMTNNCETEKRDREKRLAEKDKERVRMK